MSPPSYQLLHTAPSRRPSEPWPGLYRGPPESNRRRLVDLKALLEQDLQGRVRLLRGAFTARVAVLDVTIVDALGLSVQTFTRFDSQYGLQALSEYRNSNHKKSELINSGQMC